MEVSAFQIHKVMKMYTKQLSQSKLEQHQKALGVEKPVSDKIELSAEGKRQAVIEKVAGDIVEGITRRGPENKTDHEIVNRLEAETGRKFEFAQAKSEFVYNVIDTDTKTTSKLAVEDSSFLSNRLESLAKEVVSQQLTETGQVHDRNDTQGGPNG